MLVAFVAKSADVPHHAFVIPTNSLSLDWLLGEMRTNNPSLKAVRAGQQAMLARSSQAAAWADPRGSVDFNAGRFVRVAPDSFTDQRLAVEQTIPITGKNRLREKSARADAKMSGEIVRRRELDLTAHAKAAYIRLGNIYTQLEINRNNTRLLKQMVDTSRNRFESAKETESDVLMAETELAKLEENAVDFEQQISDQQTILNTLMDHAPDASLWRPITSHTEPTLPSLVAVEFMALNHRPEIISAQRNIDSARAKLKLSQRERIPEPNLRLEASRYNGDSQPVTELMAGISFDLPWFNHRKYSAAIEENKSLVERAEHEMEAIKSETLALVRDQLKRIETFRHHTELFRQKITPLARQTIEASQTSYQSDRGGLAQMLNARHNAQDAESMLSQHEADYEIALVELEAIVGVPLKEMSVTEENK